MRVAVKGFPVRMLDVTQWVMCYCRGTPEPSNSLPSLPLENGHGPCPHHIMLSRPLCSFLKLLPAPASLRGEEHTSLVACKP